MIIVRNLVIQQFNNIFYNFRFRNQVKTQRVTFDSMNSKYFIHPLFLKRVKSQYFIANRQHNFEFNDTSYV